MFQESFTEVCLEMLLLNESHRSYRAEGGLVFSEFGHPLPDNCLIYGQEIILEYVTISCFE